LEKDIIRDCPEDLIEESNETSLRRRVWNFLSDIACPLVPNSVEIEKE